MRRLVLCLALVSCDEQRAQPDPRELAHVPAEYPGPCLTEEYRGGSQTPTSAVRSGYDAQGRVTLWELVDSDGHAFHREESTYDAQDREIETDELDSIRHYDGSGYDRWTRYHRAYDDASRLIRHIEDYRRDGSADVVTTYRYDAAGNEVEQKVEQAASQVPDYLRLSTYDADGNRISLVAEERLAGKVKRETVAWRYDAGQLVETTRDNETDGVIDGREVREWDAEGRLIDFWRDEDGDGTPEWRHTSTYSADGLEHRHESDEDGDGVIDRSFVNIMSADGRVTDEYGDHDGDGEFDLIIHLERDPGRTYGSYDEGADGTIDSAYERTWDPDDWSRDRTESEDFDGDGVFDAVKTWYYGPFGIDRTETVDATGTVISEERYTYDRLGNLLSIESPYIGRRNYYLCPWSPFER